jgi:hypothetical protein
MLIELGIARIIKNRVELCLAGVRTGPDRRIKWRLILIADLLLNQHLDRTFSNVAEFERLNRLVEL